MRMTMIQMYKELPTDDGSSNFEAFTTLFSWGQKLRDKWMNPTKESGDNRDC